MTEKNGTKAPSKAQAVYLALQELGKEAKRGEIGEFVKERFGIDMKPDHVSTARAEALRKMAGDGKAAQEAPPAAEAEPAAPRKPARMEPAAPVVAARTPPREKPSPTGGGTAVELDDLLTLKALVGRVGAENLRKLIDIVG